MWDPQIDQCVMRVSACFVVWYGVQCMVLKIELVMSDSVIGVLFCGSGIMNMLLPPSSRKRKE